LILKVSKFIPCHFPAPSQMGNSWLPVADNKRLASYQGHPEAGNLPYLLSGR